MVLWAAMSDPPIETALVLFSGGQDSHLPRLGAAALWARRNAWVDYGQRHAINGMPDVCSTA
jgi:7-cyano-7-deazaguanine synthase in queuosine biosynthesis